MTRTLEAELKLKAVDQTGRALTSVSRRLKEVEAKAAAVNRAQAATARASAAFDRSAMASMAMVARVAAPVAIAAAARSVKRFAEVERAMTRIGITADASGAAIRGAWGDVQRLAADVALPVDEVRAGLDGLVSSGRDLTESMALLPAVARTAQAAGADVMDIATTAVSVQDALKLTAGQMERAFDMMAEGGKLGKFELKDMAQYLPSIAPAFATVGKKGEEGLAQLVAMLQVIRSETGTAGEAATSMANVFQKMETDATAKNFKKFGVDLRQEMKKARRDGKDLVEVFLDISETALKGDMSKIPQLFTDAEVIKGMRPLLAHRAEMRRYMAEILKANGVVAGDLARVLGDAQSRLDKLSIKADAAATSFGNLIAVAGGVDFLDAAIGRFDALTEAVGGLERRSGGLIDKLGLGGNEDPKTGEHEPGWLEKGLDIAQRVNPLSAFGMVTDPTDPRTRYLVGAAADFLLGEEATKIDTAPAPLPNPRQTPARLDSAGEPLPLPKPDWRPPARLPTTKPDRRAPEVVSVEDFGRRVLADGSGTPWALDPGFAPPLVAAPTAAERVDTLRSADVPPPVADATMALLEDIAAQRERLAGLPRPRLADVPDPLALQRATAEAQVRDGEARLGRMAPAGDATLGGSGGFVRRQPLSTGGRAAAPRADLSGDLAELSALSKFDAGPLRRELESLPDAVDPGAFASAADDAVAGFEGSFLDGFRNVLTTAKAEARAAAAEISAAFSSINASPTITPRVRGPMPVNMKQGKTMDDLGD